MDIKRRKLHMNVTSSKAHYFKDCYGTLQHILLSYILYYTVVQSNYSSKH